MSGSKKKIAEYLNQQATLDLLKFITCGSVDDGKSTLIGRLLYEAQLIFEDQIAVLKSDSKRHGTQHDEIDFALLVDGLAAEREQGITIDVAYRFFSTERRKFIVADTPGHEQYTRNMVTGASTADAAVILIDARTGVSTQTRRHSFICSLLGIKNIVLAVNKMDLVDYDREIFWEITSDFKSYQSNLDFQTVSSIPLSALCGDNVVERSPKTPWYTGPTLISFLESLEKNEDIKESFCMPVQWVNRPNSEFRGYAGKVISGSINLADSVKCLPSGEEAKVESILLYKDSFSKARKNQSLTVTLDREIDCSRGSVIVGIDNPIELADKFEVELVWMDEDLGHQGRSYLFKSSVTTVGASISDIKFEYNINTMEHLSSKHLSMNAIASVTLTIDRPIPYQPYKDSPHLGSFILIDRYKNSTAAAGMIKFALRRSKNIYPQNLNITRAAREGLNRHKARVLWFTGLSGSGKSSIANLVEQKLHKKGIRTYVLDGDNLRHGLNKDLGFVESDRVENIRRVSEVAKLMHDAGLVVLVSFISPFRAERDRARVLFDEGQFLEIYVDTPIEIAEKRDIKGLYAKARRGEIPNFTGIDSPYEEPQSPEIRLDAGHDTLEACANKVVEYL
ncbi:MAG: sulfate adenylyltransferase subunit CysN [Candidatus Azotimanducaceae bacterium]